MIDIEMINKIEEWGFEIEKEYLHYVDCKIDVRYKLYHEEANCLISLSEYLGDEFEEYLKDNNIDLDNWQISDMEEFFEQYGIEVY